jgi:hypothetical protein
MGKNFKKALVHHFGGLVPVAGIPQAYTHSKAIETLIQQFLTFSILPDTAPYQLM